MMTSSDSLSHGGGCGVQQTPASYSTLQPVWYWPHDPSAVMTHHYTPTQQPTNSQQAVVANSNSNSNSNSGVVVNSNLSSPSDFSWIDLFAMSS
mmetsp:Transcript_22458/g.37112  ORF Transcript_22458/g.37112 Transcript_22458/m.37112 type:complete len:94 (+) Transcript_22458:450-731(+)